MRNMLVESDYFRPIDSVVKGSRELCLMKQKNGEYTQYKQDSLTSATGEKECCEILTISMQIRKGEKPQTLRFIFSSSSWHVEYLLGCEECPKSSWTQRVAVSMPLSAGWHSVMGCFCFVMMAVFPSA